MNDCGNPIHSVLFHLVRFSFVYPSLADYRNELPQHHSCVVTAPITLMNIQARLNHQTQLKPLTKTLEHGISEPDDMFIQ